MRYVILLVGCLYLISCQKTKQQRQLISKNYVWQLTDYYFENKDGATYPDQHNIGAIDYCTLHFRDSKNVFIEGRINMNFDTSYNNIFCQFFRQGLIKFNEDFKLSTSHSQESNTIYIIDNTGFRVDDHSRKIFHVTAGYSYDNNNEAYLLHFEKRRSKK